MFSSLYFKLAGYGLVALLVILIIWRVNHAFNEAAKVEGLERVIEQINADMVAQREQCEKNKQTNKEATEKYENLIDKRDADIKRLRSQYTAYCVPIAKPASGSNETNSGNQPDKANGVSSMALLDFASECETDRIKVITLQNFINKVWEVE